MTAQLLDGRSMANRIRDEIKSEVARFVEQHGRAPSLAVVRAGDDPPSVSYAKMIQKTADQVGIHFAPSFVPVETTEADLVRIVAELSGDDTIDGIMVQEPLPRGISRDAVIAALNPAKDVDGVHPYNVGLLMQGTGEYFPPATPAGGIELLERYGIPLNGKRAVVVGRSNVVGRPMAMLLLHRNATVTICHSRTADLAQECRRAEILVAAIGKAKLIKGDMVAPGAAVVDFGVNFVEGQMVGDVDFAAVSEHAAWITPVPGGTGPMTNVMLMRNVLKAAAH
ncbi:MAG: bifunctional 5,10-methylenetetrahydrofolate dehydrogenase/5,10-methenyltetrahydrofolate cyclohydrolase [Anaerolineae bacterium]